MFHLTTHIDGTNVEVSTIELISPFRPPPACVWETCLFNTAPVRSGQGSAVVAAYGSEEEARNGHHAIVSALKAHLAIGW